MSWVRSRAVSTATRALHYPLALAFWSTFLTLTFGILAWMSIQNEMPPAHALDVWKRWDVFSYLELAERGYLATAASEHSYLIVFLPLYPWMVSLAHVIVPDWHLAALFVSNICCAGAFIYLYWLGQIDFSTAAAKRALFFFAIFPVSYFLHIAYTESLFLFLAIGSFYYARKGHWLAGGIFGALATGTRIFGVAILPALAFEYLQQRNFRWREVRADAAWLALVPFGLLVYLSINYRCFGDSLHFLQLQRQSWSHSLSWPWPSLRGNWDGVTAGHAVDRVQRHGPQLIAFVISSVAVLWSLVRLRPCYSIYLAGTWVIIFCDSFTLSSPRYVLAQFPLFFLIGSWAHRPWRRYALTFGSILFYALNAAQFARGWWAQ